MFKNLMITASMLLAGGLFTPLYAKSESAPASLPRPGNLSDILKCSGANEALWISTVKEDPYSREGNEAKRKAGWYASVAMHIFEADSKLLIESVKSAKEDKDKTALFILARKCREAPQNWRD